MKKTLITLLALSGLAMGETYTWTNATSDGKWKTDGNWTVGSTGQAATKIPTYTNDNADTYIIGDGFTVSAKDHSVGNLGASLVVGDNVTLGGNWAFIFKDITIGSNLTSTFTGDGIKWAIDTNNSSVANSLTLNSEYTGACIITSIGANSTINFGTDGKINAPDTTAYGVGTASGRNLTLTAAVTLNTGAEESTLMNRMLIDGNNIYYRDKTDNTAFLNFEALTLTSSDGDTMTKYDFVTDLNAAWTIDKVAAETSAGAYRYYATVDGIGVQYYTAAVPEPTTATLSLLALAGLAARRRRR